MDVVISVSRYLLPFLGLVILLKCLLTLLLGHPQEKIYGYLIDQVDGQRFALNMWETSIGRSKHCDIVIGYETISRSHAVISRRIDGWYIYDLNSKSGILVNGEPAGERAQIKPGDLLTFGSMNFRFAVVNDPVIRVGKKKKKKAPSIPDDPPAAPPAAPVPEPNPSAPYLSEPYTSEPLFTPLSAYDDAHKPQLHFEKKQPNFGPRPGPAPGDDVYSDSRRAVLRNTRTHETFFLTGNRVSIGRGTGCDIAVDSPAASRRHALLILYEDGWAIDDLGSAHGTFLNGSSVLKPQLLFPGDVIEIGGEKFTFQSR